MSYLSYLKLLFGESTSPPPPSWKDNFTNQFSECYNTVFNFVSYTAESTKFFFAFQIPESIQYYCSGLYDSWDDSSTYASLLSCITVLACTLATFYYTYTLSKYLRKAEKSLKVADKLVTKDIGTQSKTEESVNIFSKVNEDFNMAVYMPEMRRKSKEKRPERPIELEDRAPELMPNLRAERYLKDGLAVLNIIEEGNKTTPDNKSAENISVEYTSLKLGPQKVISMNECLQNAHSTLEFINDTPLDVLGEPNTKKINSEPSTAIGNPESLSKSSISFRAQSVNRENLKAWPKSRSVSKSTSCDRKNLQRWR